MVVIVRNGPNCLQLRQLFVVCLPGGINLGVLDGGVMEAGGRWPVAQCGKSPPKGIKFPISIPHWRMDGWANRQTDPLIQVENRYDIGSSIPINIKYLSPAIITSKHGQSMKLRKRSDCVDDETNKKNGRAEQPLEKEAWKIHDRGSE